MSTIRKLLSCSTLALALVSNSLPAVNAQQDFPVKKGFTAIETMAWRDSAASTTVESRLYANTKADVGKATISFHSFNDLVNANSQTYFGNHRLSVGTKKVGVFAAAKTIAGLSPTYGYGIRLEDGFPGSTYGSSELTLNSHDANVQITSGYVGKSGALEFTVSATHKYHDKDSAWAELQLMAGNRKLQPFLLGQYSTTNNQLRASIGVRASF